MSSNTKKLIFLVVAAIVGWWAITTILGYAVGILLHFVLPLALVAGVVFIGYKVFGQKALGGGRRTLP